MPERMQIAYEPSDDFLTRDRPKQRDWLAIDTVDDPPHSHKVIPTDESESEESPVWDNFVLLLASAQPTCLLTSKSVSEKPAQ